MRERGKPLLAAPIRTMATNVTGMAHSQERSADMIHSMDATAAANTVPGIDIRGSVIPARDVVGLAQQITWR